MAEESSSLWNVDMEVSLFHAMRRHKPVGMYLKYVALGVPNFIRSVLL